MSLEFIKHENYSSLSTLSGKANIWYTIDYPTINLATAVIDLKWAATRQRPIPIPSVRLGAFNSFEEAKAACAADLATNPR